MYDPVALGARCDMCPVFKREDRILVPPAPATGVVRLVVIGESPHRTDEKMGFPFAGQAGKLLRNRLREEGIREDGIHFTNAALCRGETDKENAAAALCCAPRLLREIDSLGLEPGTASVGLQNPLAERSETLGGKGPENPPTILTLGKAPMLSVLGTKKLSYGRGFVWHVAEIDSSHVKAASRAAMRLPARVSKQKAELKAETLAGRARLGGRMVLPTLHPSQILMADTWAPIFYLDIARAARAVKGELETPLADAGKYSIVSFEKPRSALAKLNCLGPIVAFDIETDGVKTIETEILCVGFSDGENTVVVWPWKDSHAGYLTKWMGSRERCIAHNANFDVGVLQARGVNFSKVRVDDTMMAHHSYASHLPQRLDMVVSEYCDSAPWKIRFGRRGAEEKGALPKDMSWEELTMYNACDARLTAKVWARMQGDLEREREVYEHDLHLARLCRQMGVVGMGVDHERKAELSLLLKRRMAALKGKMRTLTGNPDFSPRRNADVRRVLYKKFRARFQSLTPTGLPSTSNATLEALAGSETRAGKFASLMMKYRVVDKVRSTYVGGTREHPLEFDIEWLCKDGRAHFNWKALTVSGRLNSRIQSCPKWHPYDVAARVREIYVPRSKGYTFVYYDVSQAEMRLAAYLSADPTFMAACAGDVHANNAKMLFPEIAARGWLDGDAKKDPERGKPFRDLTKNIGFAISYCAEPEKIYVSLNSSRFAPSGKEIYAPVSFALATRIHSTIHSNYRTYFHYVEANVARVQKQGYMRGLFGRIRWFGWSPKATEVANFPIQEALAAIVNKRMIELDKIISESGRRIDLVCQVHDSNIFDCPKKDAEWLQGQIRAMWEQSVRLPGGDLVLPIDLKTGGRFSEL